MTDRLHFFSSYIKPWDERRPWWQYVFYEGEYDRDDKVVGWVIRQYAPGDGRVRHPLRVRRNTWLVPDVAKAGIEFVISERVRDALAATGAACEYLEVVFDHLYEIPWGNGIAPPLPDDAPEDAIERMTRSPRSTSRRKFGRYFELISPHEQGLKPSPGLPRLVVAGDLHNTRTVEVGGNRFTVELDAARMEKYQAVYYGGAGLICTQRVADVLREASDPAWYALDELAVERVPG